jgi:uncharacterized RDD family membrane protein YckC
MVIDNIFKSDRDQKQTETSPYQEVIRDHRLGSPLDRLAAAIIDLSVILMPVVLLLSAPIKRVMVSSVLIQNDSLFFLSLLAIGFVGFVTVVSYQALFHYFFQGTIGKKVFGLRVVSLWGESKLTLMDCFIRAVVWFCESLFFFIPHVSILSDPRRRPIHDRIANTIVVQDSGAVIQPPNLYEITFAKSILATLLAVGGLYTLQSVFQLVDSLDQNGYLAKLVTSPDQLCEEVDWALESWPSAEAELSDGRLHIALALFAAGEASKDCLKTEVNHFQAKSQIESGVAYLSQAFVYSSQSELSNQYLKRICELEPYSSSCAMAKIVENWSDSNWTDVDLGFMSLGGAPPFHMGVWAIRHYVKQRQFDKAALFIDQMSPQRALSSFLSLYRVRVLWGLHQKSEARQIANTALETLDLEDRMQMGSWLCKKEFQDQGCKAFIASSCQIVDQDIQNSHETVEDVDMGMIAVLQQKCWVGTGDLELLSETYMTPDVKRYLEAVLQEQQGDERGARDLLKDLVSDPLVSEQLRLQAELDWLGAAEMGEVEQRLRIWRKEKPSESWALLGGQLAKRMNALKDLTRAKQVLRSIVENGYRDDFVLKPLTVALYYSNQKREAYQVTQEIATRNRPLGHDLQFVQSRNPASDGSTLLKDEYDTVVAELTKWVYRAGEL